ncbi:MAG TPA: TlpA disulfide reductase family protein [Nitriliruptorales bacterium]|nr:TlpA disulfide reductase family protein [Nitriliruptorales bacterium]
MAEGNFAGRQHVASNDVRRILPVLTVLAFALAACARAAPTDRSQPPSAQLTALQPGQRLPAVQLARLDGSGSLDTGSLTGPAVINFWASWCAFCVEEMPDFQAVHRRLGDDVRFVGVDREDDHAKARMLARETGVTYELVTDPDGSFFRAVQGRGMPTTLLVDPEGRIAYRHAGPLTADELTELLHEHLDVPPRDAA